MPNYRYNFYLNIFEVVMIKFHVICLCQAIHLPNLLMKLTVNRGYALMFCFCSVIKSSTIFVVYMCACVGECLYIQFRCFQRHITSNVFISFLTFCDLLCMSIKVGCMESQSSFCSFFYLSVISPSQSVLSELSQIIMVTLQ